MLAAECAVQPVQLTCNMHSPVSTPVCLFQCIVCLNHCHFALQSIVSPVNLPLRAASFLYVLLQPDDIPYAPFCASAADEAASLAHCLLRMLPPCHSCMQFVCALVRLQ
jgi:hypothetical protein